MDTLDLQAHCITGILRKYAIAAATSPAIVGGDGKFLSYRALLRQVEDIGALIAASGVSAQDRVAVVAATKPDMIVAFLAVASVAACAPLNPSYTAAEFAFFLGDLRP